MSRERLPLVLAASVVALLFAACNSGGDATSVPATAEPDTTNPATSSPVAGETSSPGAGATETPSGGSSETSPAAPGSTEPRAVAAAPALGGRVFDQPVELGAYPGGRIFVAEQDGGVFLFNRDGSNEQVLIGLGHTVSRDGGEEGLLSVALDPAFDSNGHLWAYYTAASPRRSVLARYTVSTDAVDFSTELIVLELDQPFENHNGGAIRFGPDGMLYLGFGDGGFGDDPDGNGQDRSTLLGSIIRIDVREASTAQPYAIPSDNPFVDEAGVRPEIWAYGLRNPWRMAFDPETGALWVGDVGEDQVEEIAVVGRGENHGWDIVEGDICHEPATGCDVNGLTAPVLTYSRDDGRCSVIGGVPYQGGGVPEVSGSYLYADFCSGQIWALPLDGSSPAVVVAENLGFISSFGVDIDGEVYVIRFGDTIVQLVSP